MGMIECIAGDGLRLRDLGVEGLGIDRNITAADKIARNIADRGKQARGAGIYLSVRAAKGKFIGVGNHGKSGRKDRSSR